MQPMNSAKEHARVNRPPRSVRRRVERCLRKSIIVEVGAVAIGEDGTPRFLVKTPAFDSSPKRLYVWVAALPGGQVLACLTNRPILPVERSYFPLLVEALADAVHRGLPVGGLQVRHAPECIPVPDRCICSPKVTVIEGRAGRDDTHLQMIAESILAGVPVV